MKSLSSLRFASALALFCLATPALRAQDAMAPYVAKPIANLTVAAGTISSVIKVKKTFALNGVSGPLVRFSTNVKTDDPRVGTIDVELLQSAAPRTVATFLQYAGTAGDNTSGVPSYTNTLIQRVSSNPPVVQGGGFYVDASGAINQIIGRGAISSEAGISNTRGTLAMALSDGPNSGVGDWYFNTVDNTELDDTTFGGPFTVFGRVAGSFATLDAIAALPQRNFSGSLGGSFQNVPLVDYDGTQSATVQNLVYVNSIKPIALVPKKAGDAAILTLKAKSSNPDLVSATLSGMRLTLTYAPGATGASRIKVKAINPATGSITKAKFTVTVQ